MQPRSTWNRDTLAAPDSTPPTLSPEPALPAEAGTSRTYPPLEVLGVGGMGEVVRVRDPVLGRALVRKTIRADIRSDALVRRFIAEAELTARLEHPAIVPVHDAGTLPDGRPFFVMKEVRGRTLEELVYTQRASGHLPRRLVAAVARVAEAVAYAHRMGVVHRDIKPANIMVGDFGEVMLLDWGVARVLASPRADEPGLEGGLDTRVGVAVGTPGFMPPEQEAGDHAAVGPWSDVYALGAVLVYVLTGAVPRRPERPAHVPEDLWAIASRALSRARADRHPDGAAFAAALASWQDGDARQDRALQNVEAARAQLAALDLRRADALAQAERAAAHLSELKAWDPVERKREGWALEDAANAALRAAELEEVAVVQLLGAAITDAPELPDAHALLADLYAARHREAELHRDPRAAARWEALLRAHDRGAHAAYLAGSASLTVTTAPPSSSVLISRFEEQDRRLVPVPLREVTGLSEVSLPAGSWLLTLRAPGRADALLPVFLERGARASAPDVPLLEPGALGPDDVYVPPGPAWIGGTQARNALPRQRVWVDGFVMRRHPVTNRAYLAFLDDLVQSGREEEALRHQPLRDGKDADWRERTIYGRDAEGRFRLVPDAEGDLWDPEWPVVCVSWFAARAFVAWEARRTGQAWRLPSEIEREKAGRGADGRIYPWGDHAEPTWTVNAQRGPRRALPAPVRACPSDRSVYGVEGLAGNVRDWCLEPMGTTAAWVEGGRLVLPGAEPPTAPDTWHVTRGGAWSANVAYGILTQRLPAPAAHVSALVGIRLARSIH